MTVPEVGPDVIGRGMARGAFWMVLMRVVIRGAGLLNMIIMARLLLPEDFGLIAMAMLLVGALDAFSEFNFDVALIKDQKAGRDHYDTAWTLSLIRGAAIAAILIMIAEPAAALFDEPRLQPIISVLALSSLLLGAQNIGIVDFRKSLDFRKDFLFLASEKIVSVVISISLVLIWQDYWALLGGIVAGKLWRLLASYAMHPFRPRLSLARWRTLFSFTKWLLMHSVLLFVRNRSDHLIIGKILGTATLGLYTVAFDLANLVTSELMAPIRRALLPGYARLSGDLDQIRTMFIEIFGLTLWLGAPIAIGIGLVAEPLVTVFLGKNWLPIIPVVQILVIAGFTALLSSGNHPVFLALGRPAIPTVLISISVILLLPLLLILTNKFGFLGAAVAVASVQISVALIDFVLIVRLLRLRFYQVWLVSWRSLVALSVMIVSVQALLLTWPDGPHSLFVTLLALLTSTSLGASAYLGCSFVLWYLSDAEQGPERHLMRWLTETFARRFSSPVQN